MTRILRAPRLLAAFGALLALLASSLVLLAAAPARAADCAPASGSTDISSAAYGDDDVTLTGGVDYTWGQETKLHIDFGKSKQLASVKSGDYFTYTLPPDSGLAPQVGGAAFNVTDPAHDNQVIACAVFDAQTQKLTVVFNDAAAKLQGVQGWVELRVQIFPLGEGTEGPRKIRLTQTKTLDITVHPGQGPGEGFHKDGWLRVGLKEPAFSADRAIVWRIAFPRMQERLTNVEVTDDSEDTKWSFNCSFIDVSAVQVLGPNRAFEQRDQPMNDAEKAIAKTVEGACEAERFQAKVPEIPAGYMVIFPALYASVQMPMGGTYTNTAVLTADQWDKPLTTGHKVDMSGNGEGSGDSSTPPVTPTTTAPVPTTTEPAPTTPATTPPATTAPSEAPSPNASSTPSASATTQPAPGPGEAPDPAPAPAPGGDDDSHGSGQLPRTGAELALAVGSAAALMVVGAGLLLASRRRRR